MVECDYKVERSNDEIAEAIRQITIEVHPEPCPICDGLDFGEVKESPRLGL